MTDALHVHQCPFCELRFLYANEVKDHVVVDHPEHAASFAVVDPREHPVPTAPKPSGRARPPE